MLFNPKLNQTTSFERCENYEKLEIMLHSCWCYVQSNEQVLLQILFILNGLPVRCIFLRRSVLSTPNSSLTSALHWRRNDHDGVSNHQPHSLLNHLFRCRSKKTSKLRITDLCVGNSPGPVDSTHKGSIMRKMFPFDDIIMECQIWGCSETDVILGACLRVGIVLIKIKWSPHLLIFIMGNPYIWSLYGGPLPAILHYPGPFVWSRNGWLPIMV